MAAYPDNEPILAYAPGSIERRELQEEMDRQMSEVVEIPCIINGVEIFTGNTMTRVIPHSMATFLLTSISQDLEEMQMLVMPQLMHRCLGLHWPWARCVTFERAADLLGNHLVKANASTMLNQSKTAFQAEIDAVGELVDFWRFNAYYARQFHAELQPLHSPEGVINSTEIRPLEGFIL